jgi:hypothetical protein
MGAFDALSTIATKIRVFFREIIDELALAGTLVFPNIGLFAVFHTV